MPLINRVNVPKVHLGVLSSLVTWKNFLKLVAKKKTLEKEEDQDSCMSSEWSSNKGKEQDVMVFIIQNHIETRQSAR